MAVAATVSPAPLPADEVRVLAASQGVEVVLPGTGAHFVTTPPGALLTEGSAIRTGKAGWAVLGFGNETHVELRADSEVLFSSARHADETRSAVPAVVETELRRGGLAALADGETELRVRFTGGVAAANHARFAVTAVRPDHARVIVERGTARVVASGGKLQAAPAAGQFVEVNKLATGQTITAVQPVRGNDANAVAEVAALRFVPAAADPTSKAPPAATDNTVAGQPITTAPASPPAAAAADNSAAGPPNPASTAIVSSVPPVGHGAAPLGSLPNVDPLQAPANGANIRGPVNSPEHP